MGSQIIPRSPAFPPVLTSDKQRCIERTPLMWPVISEEVPPAGAAARAEEGRGERRASTKRRELWHNGDRVPGSLHGQDVPSCLLSGTGRSETGRRGDALARWRKDDGQGLHGSPMSQTIEFVSIQSLAAKGE